MAEGKAKSKISAKIPRISIVTATVIYLASFIAGILILLFVYLYWIKSSIIRIPISPYEIYIVPHVLIIYSLIGAIIYIILLVKYIRPPPKPVEEIPPPEAVKPSVIEALPLIETYEVNPPYARIGIVKRGNRIEYHVIEPPLSKEEEEIRKKIEDTLYMELKIDRESFEKPEDAEAYLKDYIKRIVKRYGWKIEESVLDKISYYIVRDHLYYGKIDPMMRDENVEDISCNGPNTPVYVYHRFYESIPTNVIFSEEELDNYVIRLAYLAGRHISISNPIVDVTMPDGTRINITYKREVSRRGSTFSIRKFRKEPFTIIDLINFGTLNEEVAAFLWFCVENLASILVAGGTATGKTTLLNALSLFIRPEKKIVSIEDTAELQLYHENWNPMVERTGFGVTGAEAEIRMFDLLKAALRQRPDIIIVGEVRGEEAYTMFQAMATGHGGLGSIHAESPQAVINRLRSAPMNVPTQLILTLDLIVLISRVKMGERIIRKVMSVTEPVWDEERGDIAINPVFTWDSYRDVYVYSGKSKTLEKISLRTGIIMERILEDIKKREVILKWMRTKNIRRYQDFIEVMRRFYLNPDEVYEIARLELLTLGEASEEESR